MMHQTPRCSRSLLIAGLTALFVPVIGLGLIPWQIVAAQTAPAGAKKPDASRTISQEQNEGVPGNTAAGAQQGLENGEQKRGDASLPQPTNLDFAQGLKGWRYDYHDSDGNYFDHGIDPKVRYNGTPSPFLYATANRPQIYGVITQWIHAKPYRGKRMRFSAYIKTQGVKVYAGPMFGLVGGENERTYIMERQPIKGDTDWKRYDFVMDIDADTQEFVMGMNLQGKGEVWMNHLAFEEVGRNVPLSPDTLLYKASEAKSHKRTAFPKQPVNMDFAQGLKGWAEIEEGDSSTPVVYRIGLDRKLAQHGVAPAFLTSDGSQPNGYGTMVQYINPAAYEGKRIRLTAVIKTEGVKKHAGLWIGMSSESGWTVWDAEHSAAKAPTDWTPVSLVMDVPKDCINLGLGVMVRGVGKLWINHLNLEIVGNDVPTSPVTLHISGDN